MKPGYNAIIDDLRAESDDIATRVADLVQHVITRSAVRAKITTEAELKAETIFELRRLVNKTRRTIALLEKI